MSILLANQIKPRNRLNEISYHAPIFNSDYYNDHHDNSTPGSPEGKRMFYDFYAMDQLWRAVGSGQYPAKMRKLQKDMPEDDPRKYFHSLQKPGGEPGDVYSGGQDIVPDAMIRIIDKIHDEVCRAVAKNLINYVRMAVVMEFQYFTLYSRGWMGFRKQLATIYNANKTITRKEFQNLVKTYIPDMVQHPDAVKRLLKFSKYISKMELGSEKLDPYDVARKVALEPKEEPSSASLEPPAPELPDVPEVPHDVLNAPDTTDYDAPDIPEPEFGTIGEPVGEIPDYEEEPGSFDPEKDLKERLITEEYINIDKVKKVYGAINKAGVTLSDIELGFNSTSWGSYSSMGGKRWGDAAVALLKLVEAKKTMDTEDYIHIIDEIYDLQHNSSSLLNKGPMFVTDEDLNRRYRINNVARFLPYVSQLVKNLIMRYLKYFPGVNAELELKKPEIITGPTVAFSEEEKKYLVSQGFSMSGYSYDPHNDYRAQIRYTKTTGNVGPKEYSWYYHVQKQADGRYSIYDDYRSDIQVFDKFDDVKNYITSTIKPEMVKTYVPPAPAAAPIPAVASEKDQYLAAHTRIKLTPDREQLLLTNAKMGWSGMSKYYKMFLSGGKRFVLYVFSDGSFMTSFLHESSSDLYHNWQDTYYRCLHIAQVKGALPHPDAELLQYHINQLLNPASVAGTTPPPGVAGAVTPTMYSAKELPPNAASKTAYKVHIGIGASPKNSIRLTKEDEEALKAIGFEPMMIGSDVWYKHKVTGDAIKFFPNDKATLTVVGMPGIGPVKFDPISKIMAYLPTKYSSSGKISASSVGSFGPGNTGGIKLGSMFEKWITNVGFKWNVDKKEYEDGQNTLVVHPDRKSILNIFSASPEGVPETHAKNFKNLSTLIDFLKNTYTNYKNSLPSPPPKPAAPAVAPTEPVAEPTLPSTVPDSIVPLENEAIQKIVAKYPGFTTTYHPGAYTTIHASGGTPAYSITKSNGEYSFSKINPSVVKLLDSSNFDNIRHELNIILSAYPGTPSVATTQPIPKPDDKEGNEKLVHDIVETLVNDGFAYPTGAIKPEHKIDAIKGLREFLVKRFFPTDPHKISLTSSKIAIKYFQQFLDYIKTKGMPSMSVESADSLKMVLFNQGLIKEERISYKDFSKLMFLD